MSHNHQHSCNCQHDRVAYCRHCSVVYCQDCSQEWTARVSFNPFVPPYKWGTTTLGFPAGETVGYHQTGNSGPQPEVTLTTTCGHTATNNGPDTA